MSTKNIPISEALVFGDGQGGNALLSLVEQGILRNLSQSLVYKHLASPLSGTLVGKGTMRYDFTYFSKVNAYNKSSNNKQIPQISYLLVQLKERKISATEIEDFDKLNLSTQLSSVLGMWIANITKAIEADQKIQFFKGSNDFYKSHPENTRFLPELVMRQRPTLEQAQFIQNELAAIPYEMSTIFNSRYLNVPTDEFVGVLYGMCAKNIDIYLSALNCSKAAFDTIVNGYAGKNNGQKYVFNGYDIYTDNILYTDVAQGDSINGDYAITFKTDGFIGEIHHRDCKLFPTTPVIAKFTVSPDNFNDLYGFKYENGFGIAYKELMCGLYDKLFVVAPSEVVVGSTIVLDTNAKNQGRTITFTSGDTDKATISGNVLTGVAAGEVVITATYTDEKLGTFTGTKTITVKAA